MKIPGWCSYEKATWLANYVDASVINATLELGVYNGKSLFSTAAGFMSKKSGIAWGVDSWALDPCLNGSPKDIATWEKTNFEGVYNSFIFNFAELRMFPYCNWIRATSREALPFFKNMNFGLLHIDANHSEENSLWDIENYYPLVEKDGIIVLNESDWESVGACKKYLEDRCIKVVDYGTWAVYRKPL